MMANAAFQPTSSTENLRGVHCVAGFCIAVALSISRDAFLILHKIVLMPLSFTNHKFPSIREIPDSCRTVTSPSMAGITFLI